MNLRNILWNLAGLGIPILFAAITIPWLIEMIGLERFGLLSVAWGVIGHVGLFDLGVGRAATQYVSKLLGRSEHEQVPHVVRLAASMTIVSGLMIALIFVLAILLGVTDFIKASAGIQDEIFWAALVLCGTLPIQAVSATYRGINESYADFKGISIIRMSLGAVNFLGPFLVALVTPHLAWLVFTLFISRLIAAFVYRRLACRHAGSREEFEAAMGFDGRRVFRELLGFGSWFTAGSLISFGINQSEKLAIAVLISAAAISAYAIPFEVVVRSLVIVGAISTIAFPQLSKLVHERPAAVLGTFHTWLLRTLSVMAVVCVMLVFVVPYLLPWWIGENLPRESVRIGQWLCLGVSINTVSILCFSMIHAYGRADLTTKIRACELPVYLVLLYVLVLNYGVYGAMAGWVLRNFVDSAAFYLVLRTLPASVAEVHQPESKLEPSLEEATS